MAYSIPTYDIRVRPKYYSSQDGAAPGYREVWLKHNSAATTLATTGGGGADGRRLLCPWAPLSGIKSTVWYLGWEVYIDPTWDSGAQGAFGTGAGPNVHNSPFDTEQIGWRDEAWSNFGVSSYYNSYIGDSMHVQLENSSFPNKRFTYFPNVPKGQWHSVLVELTLGRIDVSSYSGYAVPNGRVRVWLNGNDTPIDTGPTNTLIYGTNPATGHTILQGVQDMWDGFYTKNCTKECALRLTAVRAGRTIGEMLSDVPVKVGETVSDILDPNGIGPDLGPSSYSVITSRTSDNFLAPASLTGVTPGPTDPPPATTSHYGPWAASVRWNAAPVSDPPPDPIPSVLESNRGPWTTAVGWNAVSRDQQSTVGDATVAARVTLGRRSMRRRSRDPLYW